MPIPDHACTWWLEPEKVFRSTRIENKFRLMSSFHSFEMDPESGMRDTIKQFNRIRMELEVLGGR